MRENVSIAEKKDYILKHMESWSGFTKNEINTASDAFINHAFRAMNTYGFELCEADGWAWLNTLLGYDIGADHAKGLIDWFNENHDMDVRSLEDCDKDLITKAAKALGFHFDYSAFPKETPKAILYEWPEHL